VSKSVLFSGVPRGGNVKRLGKNTGNRGATLLEVVIVVGVMGIFLTAAYQFLILMNARTRSHIADQELNDRINLFFNMIAKDFRTAKKVTIVENPEQYIIKMKVPIIKMKVPDGAQTYREVSYALKRDEIQRDGIKVVQGITGVNVGYVKATRASGGETFYSELHISVSTPGDTTYNLSVVRRNPPEGDE
jgi:prepilin-type N-terminal cleavage/methylation domain-containing protein